METRNAPLRSVSWEERQSTSEMSKVRSQSSCIHLTVVDGVLVPNTPEDADKWEKTLTEIETLVASDPKKYESYGWIAVD